MNRPRRIAPSIFIAAATTLAGSAAGYYYLRIRPYVREVEGRIMAIDLPSRRATMEMTDPRSGGAMEVTGEIPPECPITIDDQPATLADLRPGDTGRVRATLQHSIKRADGRGERRITADWIRVRRAAGA